MLIWRLSFGKIIGQYHSKIIQNKASRGGLRNSYSEIFLNLEKISIEKCIFLTVNFLIPQKNTFLHGCSPEKNIRPAFLLNGLLLNILIVIF